MVKGAEDRTLIAESELTRFAAIASRFLHSPATSGAGNMAQVRAGQGYDFLDFRDYHPGDDLRRIDWRASARSRRAKVRTYLQEAGADCFICLDQSTSMRLHAGKWQQTLKLVAAIAYTHLYAGYRVALICFNSGVQHYLPPGRGLSHYAHLIAQIQNISLTTIEQSEGLKSCLPLLGAGEIYVISDLLFNSPVEVNLAALPRSRSTVHVLHVQSENDLSLPEDQACMLVDCENQVQQALFSSAKIRQTAQELMHSESERLRKYCLNNRFCYTRADDRRHWQDILLTHYMPRHRHAHVD